MKRQVFKKNKLLNAKWEFSADASSKNNVVLISLYDLNSFPIRTLHAVLKDNGCDVHSIFFKHLNPNNTMNVPTSDEIDTLVTLVKQLNPILVGIGVRSTLFQLACKITKRIKKEINTTVIWGGIHPTIRPDQSIECADIICMGEGEEAILALSRKLANGEEIYNIENLWIRKGDHIIKNELSPLTQNLDLIPFPDFSNKNKYFVENGKIILPLATEEITTYLIMSSRGCLFSCTYCCNNTLRKIYKGKGKYVRRRSVENVIDELVCAKDSFKNLASIAFCDDVFTFDIDWIKRFCTSYKKKVGLPFSCYCHPRCVDEQILQLLKDAGVVIMTMGIQSGSEEIRNKIFKRYDSNEEIVKSAKMLHKYNIKRAFDIILDNPLENQKDRRETLNLLLRLPKPFTVHMPTLTHFPETELTNMLIEKKIISICDIEDQKQKSYTRWSLILDIERDKENLFWDNLYYLSQKEFVSKWLTAWLSHRAFLRAYPEPLTYILRLTSTDPFSMRTDSMRYYFLTAIREYLDLMRSVKHRTKNFFVGK